MLKYDPKGQLEPDLAESYDISSDKTLYTFHLRKGVTWQDGQPFTANDVLFTINLITDPTYKSPLRANWQGVTAKVVDNYTITFKLQNPYVGFPNNLTFGILPQHLWDSVTSDNFPLNSLNLQPVGTGPYKYSSMQKDSDGNIISYSLVANPNYFGGKPYISKITFDFYSDENSMLDAFNRKEITGISSLSPENVSNIKPIRSTNVYQFSIPRYFAVFLNQTKSIPLANDEVRQALALATDRTEIINKVLDGYGQPVYAPILSGMLGYDPNIGKTNVDIAKANQLLDSHGWTKGSDGFRGKDGTALEINLVTTDWPELEQTAELLKEQWAKIGVKVNITTASVSDIQQNYIRPREYDALLFGQVLGADPDPYSFWDSSQSKDPGLNLSLFGNSTTDQLIESGRTEFDPNKRAEIYKNFQNQLTQAIPAVFLYSPTYIYPVGKSVQGIDATNIVSPNWRFADINKWYIATKRVWK